MEVRKKVEKKSGMNDKPEKRIANYRKKTE